MEEIEQLYQWGIWTECYTTRLFDLTYMKVNNENNWIDHHYHLYSIVWSFLDKKRNVYRICSIFLDGRILYDGCNYKREVIDSHSKKYFKIVNTGRLLLQNNKPQNPSSRNWKLIQ